MSRVATTVVNTESVVVEHERANDVAVLQESVIRHLYEPCELNIKKKDMKINVHTVQCEVSKTWTNHLYDGKREYYGTRYL